MMVLSILFFGGETLHYFALALAIGICFGIYSSVLVMAHAGDVDGRVARGSRQAREEAVRRRREDPALGGGIAAGVTAVLVRRGRSGGPTAACMLTTLFYSLLALDQTLAQHRRPVRPLALRAAVRDHIRGDGAGRDAVPARRLDPVHRRHRRGGGRAQRARAGGAADASRRSSATRSTTRSATTSGRGSSIEPDSRWFRQAHLRRTQAFYDSYGGVTIIIGRFIPIMRTFAPFLAGVAGMPTGGSSRSTWSARSRGSRRSSTRATCSATSRG